MIRWPNLSWEQGGRLMWLGFVAVMVLFVALVVAVVCKGDRDGKLAARVRDACLAAGYPDYTIASDGTAYCIAADGAVVPLEVATDQR